MKQMMKMRHISESINVKTDTDNAHCNICDATIESSQGHTSILRKHLIKHKIFWKAEECVVFNSLRAPAAASTASPDKPSVPDDETLSEASTTSTTSAGN